MQGSGFLWAVTAIALFVMSIFMCIPPFVGWMETRYLIGPASATGRITTDDVPCGLFYDLPQSGGGLWRVAPANAGRRKFLLYGGSQHPTAHYQSFLIRLAQCGWDVWALEYAGFGRCANIRPDLQHYKLGDLLLLNAMEAYAMVGDSNTVVAGASLGGGVLGMVYDTLEPQPAQICFLATFASIRQLELDYMWMPLETCETMVLPFASIKWCTAEPRKYKGFVSIVYTVEDRIVPPRHSRALCDVFRHLRPMVVELPSGTHESAFMVHFERLVAPDVVLQPYLLPPPQPLQRLPQRDALDMLQPRDALDVLEPRDALDVLEPRDALDVLEPRDASDVLQPRDGFVDDGASLFSIPEEPILSVSS